MAPRKSKNNCCVVNCSFTYKNAPAGTVFYSFPGKPHEKERKLKWVAAVKRLQKDGSPWIPTKRSVICSHHFVDGLKSNDPRSPSYNPTIFPAVYKSTAVPSSSRYKRLLQRKSKEQHANTTVEETVMAEEDSWDAPSNNSGTHHASTQTEDQQFPVHTDGGPNIFTCFLNGGNAETQANLSPVMVRKDACCGTSYYGQDDAACDPVHAELLEKKGGFHGYENVKNSDPQKAEDILKSVAGVSVATFERFHEMLLDATANRTTEAVALSSNKLLIFLMKLKLNLSYSALAVLFSMHRTTCSRYFAEVLDILHSRTRMFIYWPTKEAIAMTMPECFLPEYGDCRVILDCTEVYCASPSSVHERVLFYSTYKGGFTVKFLVGVTPSGLISFVSKPYGGRATDSFITIDSGILNLISPGDTVLADKGFPQIRSVLEGRGVNFTMPAFARPNEPFTPKEVAENYRIASVRIHVERCIQRMKVYRILSEKLSADTLPRVGKIIDMCAVLANLQKPIIKNKTVPLNTNC